MVECGDKVHFRRAGISETGSDAVIRQCGNERFGPGYRLNLCIGHGVSFLSSCLPVFSLSASRINV
jgi:hypothetical protein